MEILAKRYYHIKGCPKANDATFSVTDNYIEADVYYTKGGYSYFSYKNTPRGYFMSVSRIGRYDMNGVMMESHSFGAAGCKKMLKEVSRQTAKGNREAVEIYERDIAEFVKEVFPDLELEEVMV